jgi:hypothetical protein
MSIEDIHCSNLERERKPVALVRILLSLTIIPVAAHVTVSCLSVRPANLGTTSYKSVFNIAQMTLSRFYPSINNSSPHTPLSGGILYEDQCLKPWYRINPR